MYLGKMIVAPDTDNIREVLEDGVNAFLFDESKNNINESLDKSLNHENTNAISENTRKTIFEKKYFWADNAAKIANLAEKLN